MIGVIVKSTSVTRRFQVLFLITILISSCIDIAPDPHAVKFEEKGFSDIADFILNQNEIYEMDDFTRYSKSLNGVSVKISEKEGDQHAQYLYQVEDSLQLEAKVVSALRIKLEETRLREFIKSGDTILFRVDGFLDNSWGFMYCKHELQMDSAWFDFKGNSVRFVADVNKNWKRAVIR